MDWILRILNENWPLLSGSFGLAALISFGLSLFTTEFERYTAGLVFAVLELTSTFIAVSYWAHLLQISGKIDWFLYGIMNYTPIGLLCWAMYAAGLWCVLRSVRGLRQRRTTGLDAA